MRRIDFYQLMDEASKARQMSYAPYSGFKVGAALLTADEKIYLGGNIENAAYSPTCCAERVAFFKAVGDGYTNPSDFKAIAISGGAADKDPVERCAPCGVCRQVMREFCSGDFELIFFDGKEMKELTLDEMMPFSFTPEYLLGE